MEISFVSSFFESNIYLFLLIIPFLAQLGIPTGAMFFILLAGSLSGNTQVLAVYFLIVLLATIAGDILGYIIGKKFFYTNWMKKLLSSQEAERLFKRGNVFFNKRGKFSIFVTRFLITGIGPYLNYVIGLSQYKFRKFILYVVLGEILYSAELLVLGYIFKDIIGDVLGVISNLGLLVLIGFIIYEIGTKIYKSHNSR